MCLGFEKTKEGCCGTGSIEMGFLCNIFDATCESPAKYLFWDAVHPSQATYLKLAKIFQQTLLPHLLD